MSGDRPVELGATIDAACMLLKAAILLRDLAGAMPPNLLASMPPDLRGRMLDPGYQDAFDALPADVQQAARGLAMADPLIQQAHEIDAEAQR